MNMCERRGFLAKGLLAGEQLLEQQNLNRSQAHTSLSGFVHLGLARQFPPLFLSLQKVRKLAQRNLKKT